MVYGYRLLPILLLAGCATDAEFYHANPQNAPQAYVAVLDAVNERVWARPNHSFAPNTYRGGWRKARQYNNNLGYHSSPMSEGKPIKRGDAGFGNCVVHAHTVMYELAMSGITEATYAYCAKLKGTNVGHIAVQMPDGWVLDNMVPYPITTQQFNERCDR